MNEGEKGKEGVRTLLCCVEWDYDLLSSWVEEVGGTCSGTDSGYAAAERQPIFLHFLCLKESLRAPVHGFTSYLALTASLLWRLAAQD